MKFLFAELGLYALRLGWNIIKIHEFFSLSKPRKTLYIFFACDGLLFVRFYWAICWIDNIFSRRFAVEPESEVAARERKKVTK